MTNHSNKTAGISINMTAYDSDNKVIGASNGSVDVIGPDDESIAMLYFDSVKGIDHVEYTMSFDTSSGFESGLKDLDVTKNTNKNNVVVMVKNNGTEAVDYLKAYAIFLDNAGNVIFADYDYLTDGDGELKSGATLSVQIDSPVEFASAVTALTGTRGGY